MNKMLITMVTATVLLEGVVTAGAGELRKPYFGATPAGSFARYESTSPGAKSIYTYRRLADDAGRVVVEVKAEFMEGPGSGSSSISRSVVRKDFDFPTHGISYLKAIEQYFFVDDKGEASPMPADTVTSIHDGVGDYRGGFTFKAAEKAEGRLADHYAYRAASGGAAPTVDQGEIWLDATVPFGIVRQVGTIKDSAGKVMSSYTTRLVDSGLEGRNAATPAAPKVVAVEAAPAKVKAGPLSLKDAFVGEHVRLLVEVVPGSGGLKLSIAMENKTEEPVRVIVPKGRTVLEVGIPLETLTLTSAVEQTIEIPGGGTAPAIEMGQAGERGAVEGKFTLSVYETTPLFSGSIVTGTPGRPTP